jgi:deoxyribose-phosphate aldolase
MDLVMNIGKFKSGEKEYVLNEIREILAVAGSITLKVIIEINCLSDEEMKRASELVIKSGASYIKTGTGWIEGGANINRIQKLAKFVGNEINIKAAGGIRTAQDFLALYKIGVARLGINSQTAIEIIKQLELSS